VPGVIPPLVPTEHGRADGDGALPRPPSRAELADIARPIRAAISANVFLRARDGQQQWSGSGIVLARDGEHVAILTNRHVVESDDGRRLALLSASTVAGELGRVRVVWRAARGLDLAVVEGQLTDAAALEVMRLPDAPI
jgi:S1-C subfamily serine protease